MPARRSKSKKRGLPRQRGRVRRGGRHGGGAVALSAATLFPRLSQRAAAFGIGVLFAIADARGKKPSVRLVRREAFASRPGGRNRVNLLESVDEERLARVLAGMGQRHRVGVLRAILAGANTHASLKDASGLAAGPLYHHLRSLERAGLATFVERNRYDVSPLGRDLMLLLAVACSIGARR